MSYDIKTSELLPSKRIPKREEHWLPAMSPAQVREVLSLGCKPIKETRTRYFCDGPAQQMRCAATKETRWMCPETPIPTPRDKWPTALAEDEWPEATPRFMDSVHCFGERRHGVRLQLPPGGPTPESEEYVARWLAAHDCAHHVPVSGETGRTYCCRVGPAPTFPWGIVIAAGVGAAALALWKGRKRRVAMAEALEAP